MKQKEDRNVSQMGSLSSVFLRCALGLGFLSAVADRFGLWGAFGQPNVEWGNCSRFLEYTHTLNWYLPAGIIPPLGVIATATEVLCGLLLLVGWHTRATALLSGLLLLSFGVAMTLALGVKAPLNFAVFSGWEGPCFSQMAKASHSAWMSCCPVEQSTLTLKGAEHEQDGIVSIAGA